jgi:membrane-bound serine protease (ClpP class)
MLSTVLILAAFGVIMLCLEVILPGAIVGIVGGILIVASVVTLFLSETLIEAYPHWARGGIAMAIIVGSVVTVVLWMRYFHKTAIGRKLILNARVGDSTGSTKRVSLEGKMGIVKTDLRPSGTVVVNGKKFEAQSIAGFIERGTQVEVKSSNANSLVVAVASTDADRYQRPQFQADSS